MFCPKCATQNVDGASFCRSCGANISLVPQALTGQLQEADRPQRSDRYSHKKRRREPSIEEAIRGIMMGITFAVISILIARFSPGGWSWWYWMLIPAAGCFGKGFAALARLRIAKNQNPTLPGPQLNTVRAPDVPVARTGELRAPIPSVTEGTTRHLGVEAPTRQFDSFENQKPS
ncbi:MAG: zinc-ribbon domain-containing protein [Pyrinomonadaceae bacterium]